MSEATAQELRTQLRNGWLGSIALHSLLLLSFLPLFRQSLMTIPTEPFHWDVSLVQSAQTADKLVHTVDAIESAVSSREERAPMPARTVRTIHHAAPSAERVVPVETQTAEPITPASQTGITSSAASSKEATTASISDKHTPDQPQASDPPPQQANILANSTTAELSTTQTAAATSSDRTVGSTEPAQSLLQSATAADKGGAVAPRRDYGWLQQAIFTRLEELKRSSRPFVDQSQPLRVLVKAVVSREGTLLDSSVAKSSGQDRIDQEAMALVQRAFPMQLDRTLDRQQIVMRIPITYSRE
jgi:TonB family protein